MSAMGNRVVAANELSDTIFEFDLDVDAGKITKSSHGIGTESPVCVLFK